MNTSERICADCPADISHTHGSRERCDDCRREHNLAYAKDQIKKARDAREALNPPTPKAPLTPKPCARCGTTAKGLHSDHCQKCNKILCSQRPAIITPRQYLGGDRRND